MELIYQAIKTHSAVIQYINHSLCYLFTKQVKLQEKHTENFCQLLSFSLISSLIAELGGPAVYKSLSTKSLIGKSLGIRVSDTQRQE